MPTRIITSLLSPEWPALFRNFNSTAFRLETLQHYSEPNEDAALARFLVDGQPDVGLLSYWTSLVIDHAAAGRRMSRVRVVEEPPTDYTRFELANFPLMVAAGDDIRIIATSGGTWPAGIPQHDFWLFDDQDLWALHYGDAGEFRRAELLHDPHTIEQHRRWRDAALEQAIPVADYLEHAA